MKRTVIRFGVAACLTLATASTAAADQGVTMLLGMYSPSAPHPAVGFAWRIGGPRGNLELEYAGTLGRTSVTKTKAASATLNLHVPTPFRVRRAPVHAILGIGLYGESLGESGSGELSPIVLGVGTRIPLRKPIALRIDYRAFVVQRDSADPRRGTVIPQRLSIGLTFGL